MEAGSNMGGLIPLWILGAGFVAGIIELMMTPKPRHRSDERHRAADADVPRTGAYQPTRTPA